MPPHGSVATPLCACCALLAPFAQSRTSPRCPARLAASQLRAPTSAAPAWLAFPAPTPQAQRSSPARPAPTARAARPRARCAPRARPVRTPRAGPPSQPARPEPTPTPALWSAPPARPATRAPTRPALSRWCLVAWGSSLLAAPLLAPTAAPERTASPVARARRAQSAPSELFWVRRAWRLDARRARRTSTVLCRAPLFPPPVAERTTRRARAHPPSPPASPPRIRRSRRRPACRPARRSRPVRRRSTQAPRRRALRCSCRSLAGPTALRA